jgi:hypothetical protein
MECAIYCLKVSPVSAVANALVSWLRGIRSLFVNEVVLATDHDDNISDTEAEIYALKTWRKSTVCSSRRSAKYLDTARKVDSTDIQRQDSLRRGHCDCAKAGLNRASEAALDSTVTECETRRCYTLAQVVNAPAS